MEKPERLRTVVPPSMFPITHSQETVEVLQNRLRTAEDDTKLLVDALSSMGVMGLDSAPADHIPTRPDQVKNFTLSSVSPYKARVADSDVLQKNYESIVSRVCKAESAVQSLKLNLLQAQTEWDLSKKEKVKVREKLNMAADAYEKELKRINNDLVAARSEWKKSSQEGCQLKEDVRRLQDSLDAVTASKAEISLDLENVQAGKEKLLRRVNELKEELSREAALRASLEESHTGLLTRIRDVEGVVETERAEVDNLGVNCSRLKRHLVTAQEEAKQEKHARQSFEEKLINLQMEKENGDAEFHQIKEERDFMMKEMGKMRIHYKDLNTQLDQMQKIMTDKQSTHEQLQKENKHLYEVMKTTASKHAEMISKYEEQIEVGRQELAHRLQEGETAHQLQEKLASESRQRAHLQGQCENLETEVEDLKQRLGHIELSSQEQAERHLEEVTGLKERVQSLKTERDRALQDKENLLDEVNQAVDSMAEERSRLTADLEAVRVDKEASVQACKQLEQENRRLLDRQAALEEQQVVSQQVEKGMADMLEQKNRLAYEKGRLQDRVEQLQKQLESLADAQTQLTAMRKSSSSLEAKFQKSQAELNAGKMTVQRLESQLKQSKAHCERKEHDFEIAIKARDEAMREARKIAAHMESSEQRDIQKFQGAQKDVVEAREDNKKMAMTLESIMVSHSQLQCTVETLQQELGRKDSQVAQLQGEVADRSQAAKQLETELKSLQRQLVSIEAIGTSQIDPLRKAIQKCKNDNSKMATSLEAVVKANSQLQDTVQSLQDEVEKKTFLLEEMQTARDQDSKDHKGEVRTYEERLTQLKQQLTKEREKGLKKTNKEVVEIRRQLEDLLGKNGELSRANTDLRHKITEVEYQLTEQREKMDAQKSHIDHLTKVRHKQEDTIQQLQGVKDELTTLEKAKNEYIRKNTNQSQKIKQFVDEIADLQGELSSLAQAQTSMAELFKSKEEELSQERQFSEQLKKKYKEAQKNAEKLEKLKNVLEDKLHDAQDESLQVLETSQSMTQSMMSSNLQDAHVWFKSKLDGLQTELVASRLHQGDLERVNYDQKLNLEDEKRRAQETTNRAKEMIKASRQAVSRLADFAEVTQSETTREIRDLRKKLQTEKENSLHTKHKYRVLKDTSLRATEDLAREIELLKSSSSPQYSSYR